MQNQADRPPRAARRASEMVFADLGEPGTSRRKRFTELAYEHQGFATRRRAQGRVSQWADPDDPHRLPFDLVFDAIEACDGEVSWLDELNLFAAECRKRSSRRRMRTVRPADERAREVG